ncbi:MFS transporter [Afipia sp. P52-10]|nr:MFS transporter [Afipia sp. P52-10]
MFDRCLKAFCIKALAAVLSAVLIAPSMAESFPTRPITWVIPYPPGGNPDVIARYAAKGLSEKLGQPVLIDNRTGASGIVGTEYVAAAKPDGYTLVYASSSMMTVIPLINKGLSFSPRRAFVPIHGLGTYDMVLVTNAAKPFKDVASLVEYAKSNPKKLNYGSAGIGTTAHLASAYFEKLADIQMTHIPFRGAGQSVPSLLSNDIDLLFDYPAATQQLIESGKLRALATTGSTRVSSLPGVGTLQDAGYANVTFSPWDVILAPAGTPKEIRDRLAAAFREVLSSPEARSFFEERGAKPLAGLSDERLTEFIAAEAAKMQDLVDKAGITAE